MGSTVAPKNPAAAANGEHNADNQHIEFKDLLVKAKEKISTDQALRLNSLENSVVRGDVKDQKYTFTTSWPGSGPTLQSCLNPMLGTLEKQLNWKILKKPHLCRPTVYRQPSYGR